MTDTLRRLRDALSERYAVEREVGRGGMAAVYLAEDLKHHRMVAIKVLHPELAASLGAERFLREIEIVAGLTHPHILPLHDSGAAEGLLYYVMPYVEGESLRDRLDREGQLSVEETLRITEAVARGLDHAHGRGVVHRDVKPSNILFVAGEAVIADFGIAKAVQTGGAGPGTATGLAVGTPAYISPEQAAGSGRPDLRSDVYSLGCVAYEMLAGSPPFEGPTPQAVQARKSAGEVPGLHVIRATVPQGAEKVLRKALAPTPADRHASVGAFASALRAAFANALAQPAPASPAPAEVTRERGRRAGPRIAGTLAAVLVIIAVWHFGLGGLPGTVRPAAAGFFQERDRVVVSDFENQTGDEALGLAVREAIITDLHQSAYVGVADYEELGVVFARMRLPDTTRLTPATALEIARREGYPAVVGGSVSPLGAGFQLSAQIVETSTGEVAVRMRETATDRGEILEAVERLSRDVRRHLGESLSSLRRGKRLPEVTSASLEALELYAQAMQRERGGDMVAALPLLERAVTLDTAFAAAHRAMAVHHGNQGRMVQAQASMDRAYRFSERLPDRERYLTNASYHHQRGTMDSTAYYYELLLEREPGHAASLNNLGDAYENMGRYEDALAQYRKAIDADPENAVAYYNVMSVARSLGRHDVADSARSLTEEKFPGSVFSIGGAALNAYYASELPESDSFARLLLSRFPGIGHATGNARLYLAATAARRGHLGRALALADSAKETWLADGSAFMASTALALKATIGWAGGRPERALPDLDDALAWPAAGGPRWDHAKLSFIALGYALAGEPAKARALLPRLDSLSRASGSRTFPIDESVGAALALDEGDLARTLEHVATARVRDFGITRVVNRILAADALAAMGRHAEAAAQYDSTLSSAGLNFRDAVYWAPLVPVAHERLGREYLALADTARSVEHLSALIDHWRDADEELQPRVAAARGTVRQLTGRDAP